MDRILEDGNSNIFLDECNIFTLAHSRAHHIDLDSYLPEYTARLRALDARILFLDVRPQTSWKRRKSKYEERTEFFPQDEREKILQMYHDYLFRFKPFIDDLYERIDLPKIRLDAEIPAEDLVKNVSAKFSEIAEVSGLKLKRRF